LTALYVRVFLVSDIAVFVLKRDVKFQLTHMCVPYQFKLRDNKAPSITSISQLAAVARPQWSLTVVNHLPPRLHSLAWPR